MVLSMPFASPLSVQDRRLLACVVASVAVHALALFARLPISDEPARVVLPPIGVRVVELPPPPKPLPRVEPRPVPAPPPPPPIAVERPSALAVAPQPEPQVEPKPEAKPAIAFDPPMTEQEKARL